MAYYGSGRKSTSAANAQRVLYYIRNFVLNGIPPGRLTIVDSNAAGGNWDSEAGPGDGAYLVLESAFTVGGVKWQLFICGRSTNGEIGKLKDPSNPNNTATGIGLYAAFAPNGGWDPVAKNFGNNLVYGPYRVDRGGGTNMGPFNMEMGLAERIDAQGTIKDVAFIWIGDNGKDNDWESGIYAGTVHPACSAQTKPFAVFIGYPQWDTTNNHWGNAGTSVVGACLDPTETALDPAFVWNSGDSYFTGGYFLTSKTGEPYGEELKVYDKAQSRIYGRLCGVFRTDASIANGTKNAAGTWIIINGLMWPSAP